MENDWIGTYLRGVSGSWIFLATRSCSVKHKLAVIRHIKLIIPTISTTSHTNVGLIRSLCSKLSPIGNSSRSVSPIWYRLNFGVAPWFFNYVRIVYILLCFVLVGAALCILLFLPFLHRKRNVYLRWLGNQALEHERHANLIKRKKNTCNKIWL